jgi:hypothetical protein
MTVIAVSVVAAATAGWWLGSVGRNAPGWICPPERLGASIINGVGSDGSPTAMAAVRASIPARSRDGRVNPVLLRPEAGKVGVDVGPRLA